MAKTRLASGTYTLDFDESDWHVEINTNASKVNELLKNLAVDFAEYPSASLNIKVGSGSFRKTDSTLVSYAGTSSFAMTAANTNYVYLDDAGTLAASTSGWPVTSHVKLATVVAGASTLTSVTDARVPWMSFGSSVGSYLSLGGGTLTGDLTFADGINVVVNTSTGTKIGSAATQKLGFWNATPVVQPSSANQTALTDSTGGSVADATLADAATAATLTDNTGGSVSTTLAALTLSSSMTGSTGGTADGAWQTIPDPTDSPASADALRDDLVANALPAIRNNFAETLTELALIRSALVVIKNSLSSLADVAIDLAADGSNANDNMAKTAELVNALRSALVAAGLIKGSA